MTFYNESGTRLTETTFNALLTDPADAPVLKEVTADVYQSYTEGEGAGGFERASRLAFVAGQVVDQAMVDGLFETATIDTITPATGPAAGGTPVVIKGTDFSGAAGFTLGAVALTNFKVVDNNTITGTTGAHAAGAVAGVVQDDAGDVTKAAFFTYT
jgi:hypothetical protein